MTTVRDILAAVDRLAPFHLAEAWDNVGLLLGDPDAEVRRVLLAVDVTDAVCAEAEEVAAEVVLAHHPLIFEPVGRLTADTPQGRLALRLAGQGRAVIAAHTNLDSAPGGLCDILAEMIGLTGTEPLEAGPAPRRYKVVLYVPEDALEAVADAAFDAGAGQVGRYTEVAFETVGTGRFRPGQGAHPAKGNVGRTNRIAERRLETVVPEARLGAVLAAACRAHPYEEPVIDCYRLHEASVPAPPGQGGHGPTAGLGRVGPIKGSRTLGDLADKTREALGCESVRLAGDPAAPIERAAVLTGSGGGMAQALRRAGAQALVTGEMKYHDLSDLAAAGIGVILGGHWRTERVTLAAWAPRLAEAARAEVRMSERERDPTTWR
ncbi:MAG: Nif3-like dinuclear metal center hexameric protein [Planctomycetota bacterium]|nr:Nif3-like dinuclear metal center hexameric protein [Planctomycetota bacterium]